MSTSEFDVPTKPQDAASSSEATRIAQLEAENAILNRQIWLLVDLAREWECGKCLIRDSCDSLTKVGRGALCQWQVALWSRKRAKEQQEKGEQYGVPKKVGLHTWMA